jgi:hypothetical protein
MIWRCRRESLDRREGIMGKLISCSLIAVCMLCAESWAEDPPKRFSCRLVMELTDGSRLVGNTMTASFTVRHDLGDMELKLRFIASLTMEPGGRKAVVTLRNKDRLTVAWKAKSISLQACYGAVEVPVTSIRQMFVHNYALSGAPGAWAVLRTYEYGSSSVTERIYTDKSFSLDKTTAKDGNDKSLLREIVYSTDGAIREVRYPGKVSYARNGDVWTRTEPGAYLDLPNFDLSPYTPRLTQDQTLPLEKVTEGDMTFYRFTLRSPLKKAYAKGTRVAEHGPGGAYTYAAASGAMVPGRWTKFEGIIRGELVTEAPNNRFRRKTKYIRIVVLPNYRQKGDCRLRFDALSFGDATKNENLITNHDASLGRKNMETDIVKGDGVGDSVCFEAGAKPPWQLLSTDYIAVDTMKAYRISGWFRSAGSAGPSKLYYGVACYDSEKRYIDGNTLARVKDTFTELAVAAKPGDKVLHLKDASKWKGNPVDSTPENKRIKRSTGSYDPALNKWQPDGGEAYHFDGRKEPRYVRLKDGTWSNNKRPNEKGTYNPILDVWTRN